MQDTRVCITGAASGIGRAMAQTFAAAGARLVLADKSEAVQAVASELTDRGAIAHARLVDVADEAQVEALVAFAVERLGGLDAMLANAGISGRLAHFFELDAAEWGQVLGVNLIGAVSCARFAAKHMAAAGGGAIVLTASVAGLRAGAGGAHYSASKAALINFTTLAASQLYGTGVRVNAICPGLVETGMTQPIFEGARRKGVEDRIGQLNPLRRPGEAREIAEAALFLASEASSYVNGHALVVDGGLASSLPFVPGKMA